MTFTPATKPKFLLTSHQFEVLGIISEGNKTDDPTLKLVDLDQILERISRVTTKQSFQFTIRALVHNDMIEKAGQHARRGRSRVTFRLTPKGEALAGATPAGPSYILSAADEAISDFLEGQD